MPQSFSVSVLQPEPEASRSKAFTPTPSLLSGYAQAGCRAIVIIPARDEEHSLTATLDSIASQEDLDGRPLPAERFEILLLLNNCTDRSVEVAREWQARHPEIVFHVVEQEFAPEDAHIGTARRLLMDTAWHRLSRHSSDAAILSTDSDTVADPRWIAETLRAIDSGADAVGGSILFKEGELALLPEGARRAYLLDRRYQQLVAELEDRLDPQRGDSAPRHLEHFGASLACTAEIYARVGGLPRVERLEDLALVDALRRSDATLRHAPEVKVRTSARMGGRCTMGLSYQLREWQDLHEQGREQTVCSAAWLLHRFRSLSDLRSIWQGRHDPEVLSGVAGPLSGMVLEAAAANSTEGEFLAAIHCDDCIEAGFEGLKEEPVQKVIDDLERLLSASGRNQLYDSTRSSTSMR